MNMTSRGTKLSCRIGWWLRRLADRIDHDHEPHSAGLSFTFEPGVGIHMWGVVAGDEPERGCPLYYLAEADYERAHTEALSPSQLWWTGA